MVKKLAVLIFAVLFLIGGSGCEVLEGDPTKNIRNLGTYLIEENVEGIIGIFVFPCIIDATILNSEEEQFVFRSDLEEHLEALFEERDFLDITIDNWDTVIEENGTATVTTDFYIKWQDGDDSWKALFKMEEEDTRLIDEPEWKIRKLIFE